MRWEGRKIQGYDILIIRTKKGILYLISDFLLEWAGLVRGCIAARRGACCHHIPSPRSSRAPTPRRPSSAQRTAPYQTRLELFVRGILTEYNTIYLGNIIYLGSQKEWLTGLRGLKRYTAFRGGLSRAPRPRPPRARPYHPFGLNG